jgi:hypothetical protein
MKHTSPLINLCIIPIICILPIFSSTACSTDQASKVANNGAQMVQQNLSQLPENYRVAAPYIQEDLEKLWNNVAGGIEVYGEDLGVHTPTHALAAAKEARERLIAGTSFDDVVKKAQSELTTDDLKNMPTSDLSALDGILPFDIDLTTCGENLAEVLNNLDIGQVSAVLRSEAGYHLIQLINRDGGKVKIGHIIFQVDPTIADSAAPAVPDQAKSPSNGATELSESMKQAIERLKEAIKKQ